MGRIHRTKAGIILEKILSENKHRYLWCWNGEGDGDENYPYDCACCLVEDDFLSMSCGCTCHTRIEEMASHPHIRLWLVAMEAMDELPPFFASYAEKLIYSKKCAAEHASSRVDWTPEQMKILGPCRCEYCEFARNDLKTRKFEIEGEDNSHIHDTPETSPCVLKGADGTIYRVYGATKIEVEPPPQPVEPTPILADMGVAAYAEAKQERIDAQPECGSSLTSEPGMRDGVYGTWVIGYCSRSKPCPIHDSTKPVEPPCS